MAIPTFEITEILDDLHTATRAAERLCARDLCSLPVEGLQRLIGRLEKLIAAPPTDPTAAPGVNSAFDRVKQ